MISHVQHKREYTHLRELGRWKIDRTDIFLTMTSSSVLLKTKKKTTDKFFFIAGKNAKDNIGNPVENSVLLCGWKLALSMTVSFVVYMEKIGSIYFGA